MTKQSKITANSTAVDTGTQKVRLADTYVSEHNPRFHEAIDQDSIAGLAATMVPSGLLQNLCGLVDADGKVGIVAGRRRWHALQIAVKERPDLEVIDVKVTDDLQTALGWAMLENTQRVEMDVVDEIRAYASSLASGLSVPQVAKAYCVTEAHVYRRAALGKLPAPVLNALKDGDISMSDAQAFTVSDDEAKQLAVLEAMGEQHWWGSRQIKEALNDDKPDADCRVARFVGLDAYKKAGGGIDTNLFDDDATIADPSILDDLFDKKLAKAAKAFQQTEKLAWVETRDDAHVMMHEVISDGAFIRMDPIPGTLTKEQQARLDELSAGQWWNLEDDEQAEKEALEDILTGEYTDAQRALMGAVVYVARNAEVKAVFGLLRAEDRDKAVEAGFLPSADAIAAEKAAELAAKKAEKPAYAAKFVEDMTAIRLAAFQTALLRKPELVLDLLAFGLSRGSHYGTETMAVWFDMERNKPMAEDDAFTLCTDLGGPLPEADDAPDDADDEYADTPIAEAFAAFMDKGKKARNAEITASFARAFKTQGADFMGLIAEKAGADMREVWSPTAANCFKRMKGAQLDAVFMDLLDKDAMDTGFLTFKKLKKAEKDQTMHGLFHDADMQAVYKVTPAQKARIDAWVPACF